ncbi:MAG: ABC transporter substrate-binding protein [Roseovarius sp.]|nr:ABC transporter substrate-binding protein [Roseovarius sp.]
MSVRMRKSYLGLAGALALAASFAGGAAMAQDPIRIGVPTALSGTYADLGNQAVRAVEFAVQEANAAGGVDGRTVEYRAYDSEAKPEVARRQAEKLALEGYNILTGTIASGEGLAMAPMLERWNALYVATINKSNKISGDSCTARMFRVNHMDAQDAMVIRPWLAEREETKWAILAADIAWGQDAANSFSKAVEANDKELVVNLASPFGSNDFAPYIQQIRDSGAEGLWIALAGRDALTFANQASQFGLFDEVTTAGVSFVTDNTVNALGEISRGIYGIINYSSTLDTPENKAFVEAWKAFYDGDEPSNFEGETYLGMQVILEAVRRAGSVDPIEVAKQMEGGTFSTILGELTIRAEDHQIVAPNFFGHVGEYNGKLKPIITMTVDAEAATPAPDPACQIGELQ